ncbi:MAG: BolA/IbaG family iron-sulfur metabolism protein, partial [Paracoccaceae bacterium]
MSRRMRIEEKLAQTFTIERLEVIDESESHRGHAGFQEGGESHFRVRL